MADPTNVKSKILIVEEKQEEASAIESVLRGAGYANIHKVDKAEGLPTLEKQLKPDIIIVSPKISDADVVEVIQQLKKSMPADAYLPVLTMLGPDIPEDTRERVLSEAAKDFLTQPIQRFEVATRVAAYLEARALYLRMHKKRQLLEEQLSSRNRELENAQFELLERLAMVVEHRDDDTGKHVQRVSNISKLVAMDLGLPENEVMLDQAAVQDGETNGLTRDEHDGCRVEAVVAHDDGHVAGPGGRTGVADLHLRWRLGGSLQAEDDQHRGQDGEEDHDDDWCTRGSAGTHEVSVRRRAWVSRDAAA